MLYRNKKTGMVVKITSRIVSENWEPIEAPKAEKTSAAPKSETAKKPSRRKKE